MSAKSMNDKRNRYCEARRELQDTRAKLDALRDVVVDINTTRDGLLDEGERLANEVAQLQREVMP